MSERARAASAHLLVLAFFSAATVVMVWPAIGDISGRLGPDLGDPLLNLYFLEWGKHQLELGLPDFWSPPFFFPTARALTLSDHLFGPAVAFLGLRHLGLTPAAAYNVLLLASFVLCGWSGWWVLRRSGLPDAAALAGAWFFAFAGFRWSAIGHFQVARMQWIPLLLWSFDRLLERASAGRLAAFLLFYALHVSGGAYLAFFAHGALVVLALNRLLTTRAASWRTIGIWTGAVVGAAAIAWPLYGPYLHSGSPLDDRQPLEALRESGAVLASFLSPSWFGLESRLLPALPTESGRGALFPGLAAITLVAAAIGWALRRLPEATRPRGAESLLALVGFATIGLGLTRGDAVTLASVAPSGADAYRTPLLLVLAGCATALAGLRRALWSAARQLRPWPRGLLAVGLLMALLCLPTFFAPAWATVPGMRALRVPTRAFALALFPLAWLVALGAERLLALAGRRRWAWGLVAFLAVALVVESWPRLPGWQTLPAPDAFPGYSRWIAAHDEVRAYLELPLGKRPHWETGAMYLETLHWRPLVNGYSAVLPPSFQQVARLCRPFPDAEGLAELVEMGVTHVVVHRQALPWQPGPETRVRVTKRRPVFERLLLESGAAHVFADESTDVYRIAPAARAGR